MWDTKLLQYVLSKLRGNKILKNNETLEFYREPSKFAAKLCICGFVISAIKI